MHTFHILVRIVPQTLFSQQINENNNNWTFPSDDMYARTVLLKIHNTILSSYYNKKISFRCARSKMMTIIKTSEYFFVFRTSSKMRRINSNQTSTLFNVARSQLNVNGEHFQMGYNDRMLCTADDCAGVLNVAPQHQ